MVDELAEKQALQKRSWFRFSLTTMLWLMLVATAFFAGLTWRSSFDRANRIPVLVAQRDILSNTMIDRSDLRMEYRYRADLPKNVATQFDQVVNGVAIRPIIKGDYLSLAYVQPFGPPVIPVGFKVVNFKLQNPIDSLGIGLLEYGDRVSIQKSSADDPDEKKTIVNEVQVFNKGSSVSAHSEKFDNVLIVGFLLDQKIAGVLMQARKNGDLLTIGPPVAE